MSQPSPPLSHSQPGHLATIALGANVDSPAGSPAQTLLAAIDHLRQLGELRATSSLWRTPPVGYADQPWFHNAVVQLRTTLAPALLLDHLLHIELLFGRDRSASHAAPRNGPRSLDLDLILVDQLTLDTPALTLPHPRFTDRAFVLLPLAEIAPTLRHPITSLTIADHLAALPAADRLACQRIPSPAH